MNIDEITIGQAKEVLSVLGSAEPSGGSFIGNYLIGKYVLVRSRNEGINAGVIKEMDETGIVLTDARRVWYHKPKDASMSWYEGVSLSGLSDGSKISVVVPIKVIIEDYSVTVCSSVAEKSIRGHKTHDQS